MTPLWLIVGLLTGFYAQKVYTMLKTVFDDYSERKQASQSGVVRPERHQVTRNIPIDLTTQSGSIMRPTPDQHRLNAMKERDIKLKQL